MCNWRDLAERMQCYSGILKLHTISVHVFVVRFLYPNTHQRRTALYTDGASYFFTPVSVTCATYPPMHVCRGALAIIKLHRTSLP